MFNGRHTVEKVDGKYFIDRDGKSFRYILAYLRDMEEWVPPGESELPMLLKEAQYFGIDPLVKMIEEILELKKEKTTSFVVSVTSYCLNTYSVVSKITQMPSELYEQFTSNQCSPKVMVERIINISQDAGYTFVGSRTVPVNHPDSSTVYMSFRRN